MAIAAAKKSVLGIVSEVMTKRTEGVPAIPQDIRPLGKNHLDGIPPPHVEHQLSAAMAIDLGKS